MSPGGGVDLMPDTPLTIMALLLTTAFLGGVIGSFFEWVRPRGSYEIGRKLINAQLRIHLMQLRMQQLEMDIKESSKINQSILDDNALFPVQATGESSQEWCDGQVDAAFYEIVEGLEHGN